MVHPAISFDYKGYKRQGVSMRDLSARSSHEIGQMIEDAEDTVLAHTGLQPHSESWSAFLLSFDNTIDGR